MNIKFTTVRVRWEKYKLQNKPNIIPRPRQTSGDKGMPSWRNNHWTEVWGWIEIKINCMERRVVIRKEGYGQWEEHIQRSMKGDQLEKLRQVQCGLSIRLRIEY